MDGPVEDVLGRPDLDRPPGVHDEDPVGQAGDDAEIVGDEEQRRTGLARARSCSESSTWACTVTSRAVVGSSARITSGSLAMAMAMTTRWRMPPENSCG